MRPVLLAPLLAPLLALLVLSASAAHPEQPALTALFRRFLRPPPQRSAPRRSLFVDAEDDDAAAGPATDLEMRTRISEHRIKLARLRQESKDLAHEKAFLEKTLELKKGQRTMQDGQVKLSQAELEDKAKEIAMYKREAPRTLNRFNELVRVQRQMQDTLNRLHRESEELVSSKKHIESKIHSLSVGDLVERHARGLPDAMAGALRKSAAALIPFFDYLAIAADTNNRLVDHVGAEIDKYTHVNIAGSPFMSGMLFYCVLLIPALTFISFIRRVFDSSSKLTASHYIILGNFYFVVMCVFNVVAAVVTGADPVRLWFERYERTFIVANLFLALYYVWHVAILGLQAAITVERRNVSQFLATLSVGLHYFLFAWRRVFTDSPPMMYTFNYMMYGTIFSFVLYERVRRMSSRQLNDSAVFRLVYSILKRHPGKVPVLDFRSLLQYVRCSWPSFASTPRRRQYTLRDERVHVEDKHRRTERPKRKDLSESEDENDQSMQKKGPRPGNHRRTRKLAPKARKPEPRGFISIFFGSTENGEDSSDDEEARYHRTSRQADRERPRARSRDHVQARRASGFSFWKWS